VLVLRTASNYTMPPPSLTAAESLAGEAGELSAYLPSLEAAWRVGHPVVEELVKRWRRYDDRLPKPRQSRVSR
jgi:purine nucleoside permease